MTLHANARPSSTRRLERSRGRALEAFSRLKHLYTLLASDVVPSIAWDKIFFFFSDERHVPPDHPDSNYRMAQEFLFSKVPVPPENIFRIHTEEDAGTAPTR